MLTLFDIDNRANTLKTKLAIAHKGLDKDALEYNLEWVSYPDIHGLIQSKEVPSAGGHPLSQYTLPAIEHDGITVMGSLSCAQHLEANFPNTPSLFPYPDSLAFAQLLQWHMMEQLPISLFHFMMPRIIALLDDRGAEYFKRTREEAFKTTISEHIFQDKDKWNAAWKEAAPGLKIVNDMLEKNQEGPFFAGKQRAYADIILLAFLKWWKRCGDDIYDKIVEIAPEFQKVWNASVDILPQ